MSTIRIKTKNTPELEGEGRRRKPGTHQRRTGSHSSSGRSPRRTAGGRGGPGSRGERRPRGPARRSPAGLHSRPAPRRGGGGGSTAKAGRTESRRSARGRPDPPPPPGTVASGHSRFVPRSHQAQEREGPRRRTPRSPGRGSPRPAGRPPGQEPARAASAEPERRGGLPSRPPALGARATLPGPDAPEARPACHSNTTQTTYNGIVSCTGTA